MWTWVTVVWVHQTPSKCPVLKDPNPGVLAPEAEKPGVLAPEAEKTGVLAPEAEKLPGLDQESRLDCGRWGPGFATQRWSNSLELPRRVEQVYMNGGELSLWSFTNNDRCGGRGAHPPNRKYSREDKCLVHLRITLLQLPNREIQ